VRALNLIMTTPVVGAAAVALTAGRLEATLVAALTVVRPASPRLRRQLPLHWL
jgi:hypothetical protein